MATNKEKYQVFFEDKDNVLNLCQKYINDLLENDAKIDDNAIQSNLNDLKSEVETLDSEVKRAFSDYDEIEGEEYIKELNDDIFECQQQQLEDETSIAEFEVAFTRLKSSKKGLFNPDNQELYEVIRNHEHEIEAQISLIDQNLQQIKADNDQQSTVATQITCVTQLDELEGNLTYNKKYSHISPTFVEPVKSSLKELADAINNNENAEDVASCLTQAKQDIDMFEAWVKSWA